MEKLSGEQVLDLMRNGWSCWSGHSSGRWMLQNGAAGHGGDIKQVHGQTMLSLKRKGLIEAAPYKMGSFKTDYVLSRRR